MNINATLFAQAIVFAILVWFTISCGPRSPRPWMSGR